MTSPRIVLATRTFSPDPNAAAFRLQALVDGLLAAGADVTVLTAKPARGRAANDVASAAKIRRWPVLRDRGGNVRGYVQYLSFDLPLFFRALFRTQHALVAEAPPTTGLVVAAVAAIRRKPFTYYSADIMADGVVAVGAPRFVARAIRKLEVFVLRRASAVLSVTADVTDRLVELGAHRSRIATVGHGVDTEIFRPDGDVSSIDPYFVYTGTMSEVHSPQVFIEAFSRIAADYPELTLRFFGQGVYEEEMRELAERLVPRRVVFGGVISPTDTARWIRGARGALVSLTPGLGYDYAHPTKAYAAAACGTPIVYAGAETFAAIVDQAALGETAQHDDIDAVVAAMRAVLDQWRDGTTERRRAQRACWAAENVSLQEVGSRAAAAVLATATNPVNLSNEKDRYDHT